MLMQQSMIIKGNDLISFINKIVITFIIYQHKNINVSICDYIIKLYLPLKIY